MNIWLVGFAFMCLAEKAWGSTLAKVDGLSDGGEFESSLQLFAGFVKEYGKVYADEIEFDKRLEIFRANLEKIKRYQETERGTARYGITQFADLTPEEFRKRLGFQKIQHEDLHKSVLPETGNIPEEYDWRTKGVVTHVKNQMACGSCWAFSVVANIESLHAIKKGKLISLSEQQLVDCDTVDNGCEGGTFTTAFKYVKVNGGLETDADYPYQARRLDCKMDKSKIKVKISGWEELPQNETAMAQWLHKNGPISVGINADPLQYYKGGIINVEDGSCDSIHINHGVLTVGYGVEKGSDKKDIPYWILKNSWGDDWGEEGYFKMHRGDGTCGIHMYPTSATID